jgi:sec-independent protein translocase protein TatB
MFGIGGQELFLLMIIGLVVLGPERLPRIANQIGGWLGQARRMTRVMKRQLEEELDLNKTPTIMPPPALRAPSEQPSKTPADTSPRDDDEYSPAHGEDDVGTGIGDDPLNDVPDMAATADADNESDTDDTATADKQADDTAPGEKKEPS